MLDYQKKRMKKRLFVEVHHLIREVIILSVQASDIRESDPLVCVVSRIFEGWKSNGRTRGSTAVVGVPGTSYAHSSADCRGAEPNSTRAIGTRQPVTVRLRVRKRLAGDGIWLLLVELVGLGNWRHSEGDTQRVSQMGMRRRVA